jgi:hypothetical protein
VQLKKHKQKKSKKRFAFDRKNAYFSTEIIKNFGEKGHVK